MKTRIFFTCTVLLSLLTVGINAQGTCKVLNPKIGDTYSGDCKKGLADGQGEAFGTDQYKGEFRKGLPDGTGTYIWQTGEKYTGEWKLGMREGNGVYTFKVDGKDSELSGYWKEDKYVGKVKITPYLITYKSGVGRVTCTKVGTARNEVNYQFSRAGATSSNISGLIMQASSGTESIGTNFTGFEEVSFPFEGKIKFMVPNALNTATILCEVRLTINEPGIWLITSYY